MMPVGQMKIAVVVTNLTTRAEGTQTELRAAVRGSDGVVVVVQSLRERVGTSKLRSYELS